MRGRIEGGPSLSLSISSLRRLTATEDGMGGWESDPRGAKGAAARELGTTGVPLTAITGFVAGDSGGSGRARGVAVADVVTCASAGATVASVVARGGAPALEAARSEGAVFLVAARSLLFEPLGDFDGGLDSSFAGGVAVLAGVAPAFARLAERCVGTPCASMFFGPVGCFGAGMGGIVQEPRPRGKAVRR